MAKHQKAKTARGGRNPDRPNGKAWGRNSGPAVGHQGHNLTGRTKPGGNTLGGHSVRKLNAACQIDTPGMPGVKTLDVQKITLLLEKIKMSRNTQHRRMLRAERRVTARDRGSR